MNIRTISLAFVAITAAPVIASASPEDAALNACAKAFAASVAAPGADAPAFKVNYTQKNGTNPVSDFYSRNFTFTMKAKNPKTGVALASATCSVDDKGQVVAFNASSVPAGATLASR